MGFFENEKGPKFEGRNTDGVIEAWMCSIHNKYLNLGASGGLSVKDYFNEVKKKCDVDFSDVTVENKLRELAKNFPEYAQFTGGKYYPIKEAISDMFWHRRLQDDPTYREKVYEELKKQGK